MHIITFVGVVALDNFQFHNCCHSPTTTTTPTTKQLANEIQTFLLQESCFQLVDKFTRVQNVAGHIQYSCLDHVTTNAPEKCNIPEVFPALSSDHLPVMVTKFSRELRTQPKTIKKRLYRNFSPPDFLLEVYDTVQNGGFNKVLNSTDIEEASAIFAGIFGTILNKYAPLKVIQVRSNYAPWIMDIYSHEKTSRSQRPT